MTVRELVSRLLDFDPELIVYIGKGCGPVATATEDLQTDYVILEPLGGPDDEH